MAAICGFSRKEDEPNKHNTRAGFAELVLEIAMLKSDIFGPFVFLFYFISFLFIFICELLETLVRSLKSGWS